VEIRETKEHVVLDILLKLPVKTCKCLDDYTGSYLMLHV